MQQLIQSLTALVREAGKKMLAAHGDEASITVKSGDSNFVTVHDVAIQTFLIDSVKRLLPGAAFIAEEKDNDPAVLQAEHCLIIDPIDGTTNFIHDTRHSCVSLALLCHGEITLGMIYNPYLDELFHAVAGEGAYLNGKPIHVSDLPPERGLLAFGTTPYNKAASVDRTLSLCRALFLRCADIRRCGSAALDLANLAAGRYDLFFECCLSPWDIAAGILLIREAGGIITDMEGNPPDLARPCPIIAANPRCYPLLLEIARGCP